MKNKSILIVFCSALIINLYSQSPIVGDLEVTGNITTSSYIKLGHAIRASNRAELHLHAIGENSVSEIFFGSNGRDDSNVRWCFSDRGESQGIFNIYEGPALNGSFAPRITIKKGGYVGIGTINPWNGAKLTVENVIVTKPSGVDGYYSYLKSNWSEYNAFELGISDGSNWHKLITSSNYHFGSTLQFWTSDTEKMRITSGGNVGIGTDDPKAKLSVNGTIISKEIKVLADISTYPDFVFSDNYKLRSLKEVEKYIEDNNHLPEIPKVDEVKEGIALGEMNTKLLQKIEELTLYLIEQNKKIENLQSQINELKN